MDGDLRYATFNTGPGWMAVLSSSKGLVRVILPCTSAQKARILLGNSISNAVQAPHLFKDLIERFRAYFRGHKVVFADELDLSGATSFQCRVWKATGLIPYGETRSYMWVAEQIGKPGAVRAVGQALSRNPLPVIIPCHRVLSSDGRLGGFTGGLETKRYLLSLEASARVR